MVDIRADTLQFSIVSKEMALLTFPECLEAVSSRYRTRTSGNMSFVNHSRIIWNPCQTRITRPLSMWALLKIRERLKLCTRSSEVMWCSGYWDTRGLRETLSCNWLFRIRMRNFKSGIFKRLEMLFAKLRSINEIVEIDNRKIKSWSKSYLWTFNVSLFVLLRIPFNISGEIFVNLGMKYFLKLLLLTNWF